MAKPEIKETPTIEHVLKLAETIEPERDPVLNQREQTHGSFKRNAAIWDGLLYALEGAAIANPEQRLALNMICLKISRACQHPEVKDHWDDIAGYAKLAAEACSEAEDYARGLTRRA